MASPDYSRRRARRSLTCIKERRPASTDHRTRAGSVALIVEMDDMEQDITLDVCGLEPPEPLERVLEALDRLQPGQPLRMLIDREPRPLYRILDNNGYLYQATQDDQYRYDILIWHKD